MKPALVFLLQLVFLFYSYAQQPYEPLRISNNIILDGKLDEPEWYKTPPEDDFMQTDPNPGATPTEKTEVRILYNDDYLFVAVRAYDSEPDKLIRLELERDFPIGQDDGVALIIDSYHDGISGFNFITNTLDARWDAQVMYDGSELSDSYNTYWDVRSTVDSLGYITEFRIPFSSLRFVSKEEVTMAFRIARLIKRKNELITYPKCDPTTQDAWTNISYAREIVFHNLKTHIPFYISPYIIANYAEANILNEDSSAYIKQRGSISRKYYVENEALDKILSNIGVDAKYGLSKNLTLDLTLNTDFAQAEVDDRIINLSKYEVNLPEKRSFFLESANYLSFGFPSGNELFISRRIGNFNGIIVPIIAGARLTGKVNSWQLGALNMQTIGVDAGAIAPYNFSLFRTRKEFDSLGSFVGAIFTNRLNTHATDSSNQTMGIDFVKRITQQLSVDGGIAATLENFKAEDFSKSLYYHAGIYHSTKEGFIYSGTADFIGIDVNPVMGYIDDNNYGDFYTQLGYEFPASEKSKLQYFNLFTNNHYRYKLTTKKKETIESDLWPGFLFKNGAQIIFSVFEYRMDSLHDDWYLDDSNAVSRGYYTMFNNSLSLISPQKSNYNASFFTSYGGFYGGKRFFLTPDITYYAGKHLNLSVTYEFNHIVFDHYLDELKSTVFISNLVRLSVVYNFTTKVSLKMYIQYDDLSDAVSSNVRFRFNPSEGTDLFIVVNQGLNTNRTRLDPHLPVINNQAITIKFIKTFAV